MDFTLLLLSIIHFGQDTRGKNKLLEGKGSVGMLLSYSGCQILQFSNQMHETICAERLKNTSPRANKCKLDFHRYCLHYSNVQPQTNYYKYTLLLLFHTHHPKPRGKKKNSKTLGKTEKIKQERIMYHLFQQKKHQD